MQGFLRERINRLFVGYLALYGLVGVLTLPFYPSFAFPGGDEGTYYSAARHPWSLIPDLFEGYPPMEAISPYNLRVFLTPFSVVFGIFGFTVTGARLIVFGYGLLLLCLTFLVGRRLGSPSFSLAGTVLLSLSPQFLYFSHGVRPEGLMVLFIVGCVWLVLRSPQGPASGTYRLVGFVSASAVWVHYNGVILPVVFFVSLLIYDDRALSMQKIVAYAFGALVFLGLFVPLNLWPARQTLHEFGVQPVTFFSSSEIPLFSGAVANAISDAARYYAQFFKGRSQFEPNTPLYTGVLTVVALLGLLFRGSRQDWFVGSVFGLLAMGMLIIVPNRHLRYLYYLYPLVFLLSMRGLEKLPRRFGGRIVAAIVCIAIGGVYGVDGFAAVRQHWGFADENRLLAREIRGLIRSVGKPADVTVMGGQEFYAAAHDTRYRTFHSLIETKDFATTLRLIRPDIVILHPRTLKVIAACFPHPRSRRRSEDVAGQRRRVRQLWRDKGLLVRDRAGNDRFVSHRIPAVIMNDLREAGLTRVNISQATWNDEPVAVFMRTRGGS